MPLQKVLRDQTDEELERLSEVYERWALWGAITVIIGVVIDAIIFAVDPPYGGCLQRWGSLFSEVLVGLGIIAEVWFGRRESNCQSILRKRSNDRLAEAITKAGEAHDRAGKAEQKAAELELEALQLRDELDPREITKEQYEVLLTLQDKASEVGVTAFPDSESKDYARQIVETLRRAKIRSTLYEPRMNLPWSGIYVVVPHHLMDWASEPISSTFRKAGISAGCGPRDRNPMRDLPPDISVIMVGQKRELKQPAPPYVFTLPRDLEAEMREIVR